MKITTILIFLCITASVGLTLSSNKQKGSFKTVQGLSLEPYLGGWYEIARMPNEFQDYKKTSPCFNSTAFYKSLPMGYIEVKNKCQYNDKNVLVKDEADAVAFIFDVDNYGSKFKVNFVPYLNRIPVLNHLFSGDYWVLGLGPYDKSFKYSWAVVVTPDLESKNRVKAAWILARDPNFALSPEYQNALKVLTDQNINPAHLKHFTKVNL